MKIDDLQLSAFLEVLRQESFEKAAHKLCVTPSAISQRIRALEDKMGTLLIVRDTPCRPTKDGEKLYRHALQIELLEGDLARDFQGLNDKTRKKIPIAVNADSFATWFMEAIALFHEETGELIEVVIDDENHTDTWLKQGRVLGAITSQSKAVTGCKIEKMGDMVYLPMASPQFVDRYFKDGLTEDTFSQAPTLLFHPRDRLQHDFIKKVLGKDISVDPLHHIIPSSYGFQEAAIANLGWAVAPQILVQPYFDRGELINFAANKRVEVPLYWQSWRLSSPLLDNLTQIIKQVAKTRLN